MSDPQHPKNQHYVPRFLLANFCSPRTELIWCYDKREGKAFQTNVRNVASEKWFYDAVEGDPHGSIEEPLAELDGHASPIINRHLLRRQTVRGLSEADLGWLALFIAVQMLRTRYQRDFYRQLDEETVAAMQRKGWDISNIANFSRLDSDEKVKEFSLINIRTARHILPHLLDKMWALHASTGEFVVSDNPVAMHNTVNQSPYRGTIGVAVPGIEIYLPISPDYTLALLCRDTFNAFVDQFESNRERLDSTGSYGLRNFVNYIRRKLPVPCEPDNVTYLNSLQVASAGRFLFAPTDRFHLAREMIREHPHLRTGRRPEVR